MNPNLRRGAVEALRAWRLWTRGMMLAQGPQWARLEAALDDLAREVNAYDLEMARLAATFDTPLEP